MIYRLARGLKPFLHIPLKVCCFANDHCFCSTFISCLLFSCGVLVSFPCSDDIINEFLKDVMDIFHAYIWWQFNPWFHWVFSVNWCVWYVKWCIKYFICWNVDLKSSKLWSLQLWTQFKQLHTEAWKSQDFNRAWTFDLVILVRRSNQLSYEATDVGSWSFVSSSWAH